jgi:hypothetical protein
MPIHPTRRAASSNESNRDAALLLIRSRDRNRRKATSGTDQESAGSGFGFESLTAHHTQVRPGHMRAHGEQRRRQRQETTRAFQRCPPGHRDSRPALDLHPEDGDVGLQDVRVKYGRDDDERAGQDQSKPGPPDRSRYGVSDGASDKVTVSLSVINRCGCRVGTRRAIPAQGAERLLRPRRDGHLLPRRRREERGLMPCGQAVFVTA